MSRRITSAVWLLTGWLIAAGGLVPLQAQIDTGTEEEPPLPWEEVPTQEPADGEEPTDGEAEEVTSRLDASLPARLKG